MNMEDNESTPLPQYLTDPLCLITRAGKLNYTIDQTVAIVSTYFLDTDKNKLRELLNSPVSPEYEAYQTGKDISLFDVENALYDSATSGDIDAQEALLKLQVDKDVNQAIKDKFFPDENTECE